VVKVEDDHLPLATVDARVVREVAPHALLESTTPLTRVRNISCDIGLPIAGVVLAPILRDAHLASAMSSPERFVPEAELLRRLALSAPLTGLHESQAPVWK